MKFIISAGSGLGSDRVRCSTVLLPILVYLECQKVDVRPDLRTGLQAANDPFGLCLIDPPVLSSTPPLSVPLRFCSLLRTVLFIRTRNVSDDDSLLFWQRSSAAPE